MAALILQSFLHLGCGMFYIYGMYSDLQIVTDHIATYGGRWKYLTVLDLVIQLVYFVIAPLADLLTFVKGTETHWLVKLRDVLFASLAFPLGVFVSASFWGIYVIDRELIFPQALDKFIPPWLNHVLHTWCSVLIILEGAFVRHRYPRNFVGVGILVTFTLMYLLWISWIAYVTDIWVYPFLRIMPNSGRAIFFVLSGCVFAFFYFLGKWMTLFVWGAEREDNDNGVKPKEGRKKVKKAE